MKFNSKSDIIVVIHYREDKRMNFKRIIGIALALVMTLALVPAVSIAANVTANEAQRLGLLDEVWNSLEAVEAEAMANGAKPFEVTLAVYSAALQNSLIDSKSCAELDDNGFCFTVEGMNCLYDYKCRNTSFQSSIPQTITTDAAEALSANAGTKNGPTSMNVLLVGPYYSSDGSFTDQYKREAQSIADTTGGEYTLLDNANATGPAIAAAFPDNGVVIYDSHGTQSGTSSYLCLTTNSGITSTDYSNGWAVSAGSAAYIDGRYIQNHITGTLPNTLVWMAICEGMKANGNGTTGYALIAAGAGCVYGYSQSVTFSGDYVYEATFWTEMKNGATVADAYATMVDTHGIPDPYGDAYPIVMSPVDDFPANPDGAQQVYCDWSLFGGNLDPVELTGYSLSETDIEIYEDHSGVVNFVREPFNASNYTLSWTSNDTSVATVSGNDRRCTVTGVDVGSTTVDCMVIVNDQSIGTVSFNVNVLYFPNLSEAANADGSNLTFTSTGSYPWRAAIVDGVAVAQSGNSGADSTSSSMSVTLQLEANDVLSFDAKVSSESNYDFLKFYVNNTQYGASWSGNSGNWLHVEYTAASAGSYTFTWTFSKDVSVAGGDDCGYVDNVKLVRSGPQLGDINGDMAVTSADALLLMRYTLGTVTLTADQLSRADVNGDGKIDGTDVLLIMRASLSI